MNINVTKLVAGCLLLLFLTLAQIPAWAGDKPSEPQPLAVDQASENEPVSPAVIKRGMRSFFKCRSCHTLKPDEGNLAGPNLHGFVGAVAATKEDYNFSAALSDAKLVWNEKTLRAWLKKPSQLVSGTKMVFAGLSDEDEITALIEYLKQETQ